MDLGKITSCVGNQAVVEAHADSINKAELGSDVFLNKSHKIGIVFDIIGRVSSPYVVVRLNKTAADKIKNSPEKFLNEKVNIRSQ